MPALTALEPDQLAARPDSPYTVTLIGAGIAADTVADIGTFTSLPCQSDASVNCAAAEPATCATACTVELPDALRLSSGLYPVGLRTPAPVVDGAGRSVQQRYLTLLAPRPLIDAIDPMGVAVGEAPLDAVPITVRGHDLADNVQFSLAGRPPVSVDPRRDDPEDPGAVTARLVFELSGLAPDLEADRILARVELPFGLAPAVVDCPPTGPCRIPLRRSLGQSPIAGQVRIGASMPDTGRAWSLQLTGPATWWTLRDYADRLLARVAPQAGLASLPLPGPQPGARVVADVPAHAGGTLVIRGRRPQPLDEPPCPEGHEGRLIVPRDAGPVSAALFTELSPAGWPLARRSRAG